MDLILNLSVLQIKGGKEVLMNFELFLGNNKEYFSGRALKDPFNSKYEINSPFAKMKINIHSEDDMDSFVSNRIKLLSANSDKFIIDKERLDNIDNSLWVHTPWNERPLLMLMNFRFPIQDIKLEPLDTKVIQSFKDNNMKNIIFDVDFYGYDGDGLIGHVNGFVECNIF